MAADMEKDVGRKLFRMVVEEWVKIGGFHFAHSCLVLYKQSSKKMLQDQRDFRTWYLPKTHQKIVLTLFSLRKLLFSVTKK